MDEEHFALFIDICLQLKSKNLEGDKLFRVHCFTQKNVLLQIGERDYSFVLSRKNLRAGGMHQQRNQGLSTGCRGAPKGE